MQHISEQKSNRIVLKTGWTRDEGVCSQSGPGERRHQACPRNSHSPQGPVAQFYKEPKMIHPDAKLFFPATSTCAKTALQGTHALSDALHSASSGRAVQLLRVTGGCCLKQGGGGGETF